MLSLFWLSLFVFRPSPAPACLPTCLPACVFLSELSRKHTDARHATDTEDSSPGITCPSFSTFWRRRCPLRRLTPASYGACRSRHCSSHQCYYRHHLHRGIALEMIVILVAILGVAGGSYGWADGGAAEGPDGT